MDEEKKKRVEIYKEEKKSKKDDEKTRKEEADLKSYKLLMDKENMKSNKVSKI